MHGRANCWPALTRAHVPHAGAAVVQASLHMHTHTVLPGGRLSMQPDRSQALAAFMHQAAHAYIYNMTFDPAGMNGQPLSKIDGKLPHAGCQEQRHLPQTAASLVPAGVGAEPSGQSMYEVVLPGQK